MALAIAAAAIVSIIYLRMLSLVTDLDVRGMTKSREKKGGTAGRAGKLFRRGLLQVCGCAIARLRVPTVGIVHTLCQVPSGAQWEHAVCSVAGGAGRENVMRLVTPDGSTSAFILSMGQVT